MLQFNFRKYLSAFKILILFFGYRTSYSQSPFHYVWPIDSPFVITGNYGELRPNHFHAGIDFSTRGIINLPVYCIEEGYVSRIRISPNGYGKCVYITHPGGKVSVYAHLNAFSLKIDKVSRTFRFDTQSNEIDYAPPPRTVYVRKNEIIGLSGNTGGSTGPHLHFEIRDELSEIPLNPLGFFRINDHTPPEITSLAFYDLRDTLAPVFMNSYKVRQGKNDSLVLSDDHLILGTSIAGLAFSGLDRCYSNGNANNIFAARIYLDDSLVYMHQLNNISFLQSRFINEFSETIGRSKYQKCFLPTLYLDGFFGKCRDKGRLLLNDSSFHKIKLFVTDESGNTTRLQFYLKARQMDTFKKTDVAEEGFVNCNENVIISKGILQINVPPKSLFYSTRLWVENALEADGKFSILPRVNLMQGAVVGVKLQEKFLVYRDKLILKGEGTSLPVNRNDSAYFVVKDFGKFYLSIDTVAPKIKVNYSERRLKDAWQMDSFSFEITDNSSGIGKYNVWLNNGWVLAEYDAKTDLLTYYFDEDTPIGLLQFNLEVEDKVGNKALLEYTLKK